MRLQLSIWAEDLPNASSFGGKPDPFAVVTVLHKEVGVKPTLLGKTEVIPNTNSPDWTKILVLEDFELGKPTHMVVSIYDGSKKANTPMGTTVFEVGSVLGAKGNIIAKELKTGGILVAHLEETTGSGMLEFQLRALQLINTEGMGLMNRSDPFFELQRMRRSVTTGARVWDCVFRSHTVDNCLSPIWGESAIELSVLCGGNSQQKCRLVVYDFDKSGKHDIMGSVQFSVDDMLSAIISNALEVDDIALVNADKVWTLTKAGKDTGKVLVAAAQVTGVQEAQTSIPEEPIEAELDVVAAATEDATEDEIVVAAEDEDIQVEPDDLNSLRPTFVNYIAGGCQLHVITAIDATASNGDPRQPTSLHHFMAQGKNDYEDALFSICTILSKYDSDQKYPVYGFGAKQDGVLNHCFQIGSTPEVDGVQGITEAYSDAFKAGITMSSPRCYSEVLAAAAKNAKAQMEQGQGYSVLLIFTNGSPADSEKTLAVLKAVDDAPLSVVIIGVGEGDFRALEALVASQKASDSRDNVRFVNYQSLKIDHVKLTEAALDAIPDQLVAYFVGKGIDPLPEADTDDVVVEPYKEGQDVSVPICFTEAGDPVVSGDARPPEDDNSNNNKKDDNSNKKDDYAGKIKSGFMKFGNKMKRKKIGQMKRRVTKDIRRLSKQTFGMSPI